MTAPTVPPTHAPDAAPELLPLRAAARRLTQLTGKKVTVYTIWRLIAEDHLDSRNRVNAAGQTSRVVTRASVEAYGATCAEQRSE